jgi:eukaryotic-like serine/threonine-protein kinase
MIVGLRAGDPQCVGPYQLLGRLGCGGMGSVFLGRPASGSLVAVKVIRADLAGEPGFRARFGQEVAAAGKVSGQFTAALADADTTGPVPWLATSYVPGPSLSELVRLHGALSLSSVLVLGAGLAGALAAIHAADVVHRDLKPSNVLVAADGPRVIDFGISRAAGAASLTLAGMVMGSPGFMSPEQAEGGPVGPASDVFSLGTLLAFAATGQGPFGAGSMAALLYRVVYGQPSTERLPGRLRPLVERCLAKDPEQRPSPAELQAELGAARPAVDWLPAPVAQTLSRFAAPEAALAEAVRAEAVRAEAVRAEAVRAEPALAQAAQDQAAQAQAAQDQAAQDQAAAARPGWAGPADQPVPAADSPVWLPLTGSQLPVPASPGLAGLASPLAAVQLSGMGGEVPETGMKLPVVGGEPAVPGQQPAGPDEEPTVTAARPRPLRDVPRPRAVAVAPPRHPGRRRRSRLWAAAGAGTGAAGVLLAVGLTGVLQPAVRPAAHPARTAAKLPDPAAVVRARGSHRPAAHHHRHRGGTGASSGVTMAVAASSSPAPGGGTQPGVAPGAPSHAASPRPSTEPATPASTYTQAVPGSQGWTDTGITLRAGDRLTIAASGEIYLGATAAGEGPAGNPGCTPAASYPAQSAQFPAPGLSCWSLIARIGAGAPFEVGSSAQLTAASGDLYLGINGDTFTGNSGSWQATITVRSR